MFSTRYWLRELNSNSHNLVTQLGYKVEWFRTWFWNPDRTIRSDQENHNPLTILVLLPLETVLSKKSRKPFKPRLNRSGLRTVNGFHGSSQRYFYLKNKNITNSQHQITIVEALTITFCQTLNSHQCSE